MGSVFMTLGGFMSKFSTEEFIKRAIELHGDRYNYSLVVYSGMHNKVTIVCKEHGKFSQKALNHIHLKSGCPECKKIIIGNHKRKPVENFISESEIVHGKKYDYSLVDYKDNKLKVKIICPEHGTFEQSPGHHLRGCGCTKCNGTINGLSKRLSQDEYIRRCKAIHKDLYDYSKTVYKTGRDKVTVTCKVHGDFIQNSRIHVEGGGCPTCANSGFASNKPANFYIATNGHLTKIGITNKHPSVRLDSVSKSAKSNFKLIEYFNFTNGSIALALETFVLSKLRSNFEQSNTSFDGSKECFHDVPYQFIQQNVGKFLLTI